MVAKTADIHQTVLDAAREYVAAGRSVIPLRPGDKRPAIDSWKEYQSRLPRPDELEEWFGTGRKNIAIVTGAISGIVVIDVDGPAGEASLADLEIPETVEVRTRAGRHLYSRHPRREVRNRTRVMPGIDIRGDGGYVVAPPSVVDGVAYEFVHALKDTELAELPAWFMKIVETAAHTETAEPVDEDFIVTDGARNDRLTSEAGYLRRRRGWTVEAIAEALLIWNARHCRPPLEEKEVREIAKSAGRWEPEDGPEPGRSERRRIVEIDEPQASEHSGYVVLRLRFDDTGWQDVEIRKRDLASRQRAERQLGASLGTIELSPDEHVDGYAFLMSWLVHLRLLEQTGMDAADLYRARFPEPKTAIPGLLVEGLTVIGGAPKIGKSWLFAELAVQLGAGGSVLGRPVDGPREVLVLALEDSLRRLRSRLRTLYPGGLPAAAQGHVQFETSWAPFSGGGLDLIRAWHEKKGQSRHHAVLVDTLQRMRLGENRPKGRNAYEQDVEALAEFQEWSQTESGLSVVTSHHTNKSGSEDFVEKLSGSIGLPSTVDTIILMSRPRNEPRGKLELTSRDLPELERAVSFDGVRWRDDGDLDDVVERGTRGRILAALSEHGTLGVGDLAGFTGLKPDTVKRQLYRMRDEIPPAVAHPTATTWALP